MKPIVGSIVALVTPMLDSGDVDYAGLRKLIDWHVAEGTDCIGVVGTTGESPTVTVEEHCEIIRVAVEHRPRVAAPLVLRRHRQVEQVQFLHAGHGDEITEPRAARIDALARQIARIERIDEVAAAPRILVGRRFDRQQRVEIGELKRHEVTATVDHRRPHGRGGDELARRAASRSSVVSATLSRRYSGNACAASIAAPSACARRVSVSRAAARGDASGMGVAPCNGKRSPKTDTALPATARGGAARQRAASAGSVYNAGATSTCQRTPSCR